MQSIIIAINISSKNCWAFNIWALHHTDQREGELIAVRLAAGRAGSIPRRDNQKTNTKFENFITFMLDVRHF